MIEEQGARPALAGSRVWVSLIMKLGTDEGGDATAQYIDLGDIKAHSTSDGVKDYFWTFLHEHWTDEMGDRPIPDMLGDAMHEFFDVVRSQRGFIVGLVVDQA